MNKKPSIIIVLFFLTSFILLENPLLAYEPVREPSRQKACFSNQRVFSGAVEMYNMDYPKSLVTALPGRDFEDLENKLIKNHYLKTTLERPERDCSYGFIVKNLENFDYIVFCKRHGTVETTDIDKPIIPSYDVSREKPFSIEFTNKMAEIEQRKRREKRHDLILSTILSLPVLLFIVIVILAIVLPNKKKKKEA